MDSLLLFSSTHFVLKTEKELKRKGFDCRVIPTPRRFSSDCDIAVLVKNTEPVHIGKILNAKKFGVEAVHEFAS